MDLGIQCILLDFHKSLGNKAQMLVKSQLPFLQCLLTGKHQHFSFVNNSDPEKQSPLL